MENNKDRAELNEKEMEAVSGGRFFKKTDKRCPKCGKKMGCNIGEFTWDRRYICQNCNYEEKF